MFARELTCSILRILKDVFSCFPISGGGAREKVFWHNYFFHCAYTRYTAGLSIDEIWSFQPEKSQEAAAEAAAQVEEDAAVEETVVFDNSGEAEEAVAEAAFPAADSTNEAEIPATTAEEPSSDNSPANSAGGFELVDDGLDAGSGDPELDELEAEIARELED